MKEAMAAATFDNGNILREPEERTVFEDDVTASVHLDCATASATHLYPLDADVSAVRECHHGFA